jgi:predicted Zn-ribbon and HTH transcriptional regulator
VSAVTGAPGSTEYGAPLTCPSCGHEFRGRWIGLKTGTQRCPKCRRAFEATWPGFPFEPETVIVSPSGEMRRGAA